MGGGARAPSAPTVPPPLCIVLASGGSKKYFFWGGGGPLLLQAISYNSYIFLGLLYFRKIPLKSYIFQVLRENCERKFRKVCKILLFFPIVYDTKFIYSYNNLCFGEWTSWMGDWMLPPPSIRPTTGPGRRTIEHCDLQGPRFILIFWESWGPWAQFCHGKWGGDGSQIF